MLEALELAALFLFGADLVSHTAHRQKIATNHFRRLRNLIRNVPEFQRRVAKTPQGKGSEAIELVDGRRIEFSTRQSGNARGLSADFVIFDEAMCLSDADLSSIIPTMSAQSMVGNPQVWYVGSAVDQLDATQDGVPFARIRDRALSGEDGIAWMEWSASGDDPSRVSDATMKGLEPRRQANPGLGVRMSWDWTEHERTVDMSARGFAVERLGIGDWPATTEDAARVISRVQWDACRETDREKRITSLTAFAVDVNPERTSASIGVAGRRTDGLWQFAIADRRKGVDWVPARCVELLASDPFASFVVLARSPADALVPDLEDAGLRVERVSGADYGMACAGFYDAVDQHQAWFPDPQRDVEDALAGARKGAVSENAWHWSRKASTAADISPLVAVTLALWAAMGGVSAFATVILPDHRESQDDPVRAVAEHVGAQVLTPDDYTTCFRCATGSPCPLHAHT